MEPTTQPQTRAQKLATRVFAKVQEIEQKPDQTFKDRYGSMAHHLPILIRTAGLTQALAFVQARGQDAHKQLLDHLAQVVLEDNNAKGDTLAQKSRTAELRSYIFLTQSTLDALLWFKRFAQSVLKVEPSQEQESQS